MYNSDTCLVFNDDLHDEDEFWEFANKHNLLSNIFLMVVDRVLFVRKCLNCGDYFITDDEALRYCLVENCFDRYMVDFNFTEMMRQLNYEMIIASNAFHSRTEEMMRLSRFEERKAHDEIAHLPRKVLEVAQRKTQTNDAGHKGDVYLVAGGNGMYKIGIAKDVDKRFKGLQAQSPVPLTLIHHFLSSDYRKAERILHEYFSGSRSHYEWFELSDKQVSWFCGLANDDDLPSQPVYNQS